MGLNRRLSKSTLGAVIILLVVAVLVVVPYAAFRGPFGTYSLGVLFGLPSGFLFAFALYWLTGPTLKVDVAGSKYDGVSDGFWVQLAVRNSSWNILGSGTASGCVGKVKFVNLPEWGTSWKSRPNPQRELPIQLPGGQSLLVKFADPLMFEQKRTETIRPGEEKWLDVVWRPKGHEEAYLSIPEHFQGPRLTLFQDLKLGAGEHPFTATIEYVGGKTKAHRFVLVNKGGMEMSSDSLFIKKARYGE